ncbi:hypothetical protein IEQ34_000529 [Dendrobium chrysotoxum]|uniref:Uncharacterized protein n=1 Tax=Dendrobium chrysotoxum TaxID=161865 RepID=A0AAV7HNT2_DENCH|nr:hypothetical protein IEQ34_000529 [Dendrobium chrysotoxum]
MWINVKKCKGTFTLESEFHEVASLAPITSNINSEEVRSPHLAYILIRALQSWISKSKRLFKILQCRTAPCFKLRVRAAADRTMISVVVSNS